MLNRAVTLQDLRVPLANRLENVSPQFWPGPQMDYDLDVTQDALAECLEQEVRPHAAVS